MNIINFEEFISEGLWKKGFERNKTGEKRIEDLSDFDKYLKNIYWVDLNHPDVLFAEVDFIDGLSFNDIKNLNLPNNIHIMDKELVKWIWNNCKKYNTEVEKTSEFPAFNYNKRTPYKCIENGEYTYLHKIHRKNYLLNYKEHKDRIHYDTFENGTIYLFSIDNEEYNEKKFIIKLVKQK